MAEADGAALQCTVVRGGTLQSRKSLAAPGLTVASPTLTEEDLQNLQLAGASGVTGVMLPFVRGAEDIRTLRRALEQGRGRADPHFCQDREPCGGTGPAGVPPPCG